MAEEMCEQEDKLREEQETCHLGWRSKERKEDNRSQGRSWDNATPQKSSAGHTW